jgi:hypothetical protein
MARTRIRNVAGVLKTNQMTTSFEAGRYTAAFITLSATVLRALKELMLKSYRFDFPIPKKKPLEYKD